VLDVAKFIVHHGQANHGVCDEHVLHGVDVQNNKIMLTNLQGMEVLQVNSRTSQVLNKLNRVVDVHFDAVITQQNLTKAVKQIAASKLEHPMLRVTVNVYGPKSHSEKVNAVLSKSGIFLQEPLWHDPNSVYDNPQMIIFNGISEFDVWLRERLLFDSTRENCMQSRGWTLVLDDLPQHQATTTEVSSESMATTLYM
jgi:hypothetical protein